MSEAEGPPYSRRRQDRERRAEDRERSDRDAKQREGDSATFNAILEEIRGYRAEQNESEPKKIRIERVAAVAAIIAAALSLGSLVAFIILTLKTDSTADKALRISIQQVLDSENTQRAFVIQPSFSGPEIFNFGDGKTMSRYTFEWENSGATAALHFRANVMCVHVPFEITDGRETILWQIKAAYEATYLGPKETADIGNCSIRDDLMKDLAVHRQYFYLAARADYLDIFGHPHVMKDCSEIIFQPNSVTDFATCPGFPCTDKDCQ